MGELLGIGCPHGPQPRFTDETMANNYFTHNFESELTPAYWKDPSHWPAAMREEWSDDGGVAAGRKHRAAVLEGYRKAREALDAFSPDLVVMFGDDQYENFREDLFPPFAVYACEEYDLRGAKGGKPRLAPNGRDYGIPMERPLLQPSVKGDKRFGTHLAGQLIMRGFDVAC